MYLPKLIVTVLLFIFTVQVAIAQEYKAQAFYQISHRRGQNKPHRENIMNLDYPYRSVDLKVGWQTQGEQVWQQVFRYPRFGVGLNRATFTTDTIGNPMALYFFMQFPQVSYKRFSFDLEFDFGPSFGMNPWDPITNPNNESTGTSTNMYFCILPQISGKISDNWDAFIGGGLVHYSNGALGNPNIGLNAFSLDFGLRYTPQETRFKTNDIPEGNKKWYVSNYVGTGVRRPYNTGQELPIFNWVVYEPQLLKRVSHKRRAGIGLELAFNENYQSYDRDFTIAEKAVVGILVIHEFMLNKFVITNQIGVHLLHPYDWKQPVYERVGFGYYLNDNFRINLNLRAVGIKADFFELGFNYDFAVF